MKTNPLIAICFVLIFEACQSPVVSEPVVLTNPPKDLATCGAPPVASANDESYFIKPIKLISEALGVFERKISTKSPEAQNYFNQGLQLRYAFAVNEAASSFREAQKLDSTCAMCYWGEAWALGSYLNGHMPENKAPLAYAAILKAQKFANQASAINQAIIEASMVRFIEDYKFDERRTNDSLYAEAMKKVYDQYPDDADVATLYADALFLLEPRRGTREMDNPRLMIIHDVLEKVLAEDIRHPGACHLYIHATESTDQPELAESCADFLGNTIPGASHINHMPSHTYNEIGRWGDGVRANLQASLTDKRALEEGSAFAIYPGHNLHMLLYAASYDGQGAIAMQAGRDYAKLEGNNIHHAMTAIRFGRFDDVLELDRPESGEISQSMWDFCQGYARLKTGETDFARLHLKRVVQCADSTKAKFRFEPGGPVLKVLAAILEGEIEWMEGNKKKAVAIFQRGVAMEDQLPYNEPEALPFSIRHWLGAAQMEMNDHLMAEKTYRDELDDHPNNGWSLFGLREALKAQGKNFEEIEAQFVESWARSDTYIESSRF